MDVTIAICTHNRRAELHRTLEGIRALAAPGHPPFEVLVIDNGSTDGTAEMLASARYPGITVRVVPEPMVGISHARNRAIDSARGDYILMLDDDVTVLPDLLTKYDRATSQFPDAPYLGGPIIPVPDPPVSELALAIAKYRPGVFSELELGPDPLPLAPKDGPWGANCLIRVASIGATRFDHRFGYGPHTSVSGEETEFLWRIYKSHGPGRWVPGARVEHRIQARRATWEFLRRWAYTNGRTGARLAAVHERRKLAGMVFTSHARRWALARQADRLSESTPIDERLDLEFRLWHARGVADEVRNMALARGWLSEAQERAG